MKPRTQIAPRFVPLLLSLGFVIALSTLKLAPAHAQGQVQVTAADPMSAQQGTINLNVRVTGKGFKNGAQAKWFVTGTTNPGGVTVNSTSFVSSTELTANITVDDGATVADFDIQVLNSDGRGGKGTELFKITSKLTGSVACPAPAPLPSGDSKCYLALPGCLDSTFGGLGLGFVSTDIAQSNDSIQAMVVQPDGKIILAGSVFRPGTTTDYGVVRYNLDGSLDTSFGDPDPFNPTQRLGYAVTSVTTNSDYVKSLALQSDGKIVIVGESTPPNSSSVVRYNSDGTLDGSFGNGGIDLVNFGRRQAISARDVVLQADGKIVIGGSAVASNGAATGGFGLVRLLANGAIDSSFGSSGTVVMNPSGAKNGSAWIFSMAIQRVPAITGEERLVLGGASKISDNAKNDWTLMRFKPNGAVDTTFGSAGIVKTAFSGFGDGVLKLSMDPSNRIVAVGTTRFADANCGGRTIDIGIARYLQNGSLDATFAGGKQTIDIYGGMDQPYGLTVQQDNKVVITGYSNSSDGSITDIALVRLNADGSRDTSFGLTGNGVVTANLYGFDDYGIVVATQPSDGKILVGGSSVISSGTSYTDFIIARYLP